MLNLVVVSGSSHVGASIVHYSSQLKGLTIVGQSQEAEEAMEMISAKRPHIVVLDVELKDGLGLEVLHRTKRFGLPPVVIMTSASSYAQYRSNCIKQGADYYFRLPDEIEGLVKVLTHLASLFSAADQNTTSEI